MTITPTDADIAEVLRLIDAAPFWTPGYVRQLALDKGASADWWTAIMILAHAATVAKLRVAVEALEYYADRSVYIYDRIGQHCPIENDAGDCAHQTLAQIKDETHG
jgi:hypothetical protein